MKVVFLTSPLSEAAGGLAASVPGLAGALAETKVVEASIVGLADPDYPEGWRTWEVVEVHPHDVVGPRRFGYAPKLLDTLVALDPDIVHVQGLWMYPSVASLRWHRRTHRPHLISPRGMLTGWALERSALRKRAAGLLFERAHLAGAACLHALSPAEAGDFRKMGLRNPICVIPNGVHIPNLTRRVGSTRQRTLLFLGRIDAKKGVRELLQAWSLVHTEAERDGWRLEITGWTETDYGRQVQRLREELGLETSVTFTGPKVGAEKAAAFSDAAAFILPSFSEGLPMAVLEAWAHGLPVLMTADCNLPEGFDARAALPLTTEPLAIAEGLRQLFDLSDTTRHAIGEAGRQLAVEQFSWQRVARDMLAVYEWTLGGGVPPPHVLTS